MAVKNVREFISEQPEDAQVEYLNIVDRLERDGYLVEPYAKKLEADLFEIRVRRGRQVRIFYFYHDDDLIFGVHAFVKKTQKTPQHEIKKTQKTPQHEIKQARKVVQLIKRGDYNE